MTTKRILCLGSALWDTIFSVDHIPSHGGKVLPSKAVQLPSGMATAAAVSIARLGGDVSLWARIGADDTGKMLLEGLAAEGVDVANVRRIENAKTPFSTILVDKTGERLVVPYFDRALDTDTGWLPLSEVRHASAVLCDMRWIEGAQSLFCEARRVGVPTILDADVAPVSDLRYLMPYADHVLLSEPALQSLSTASSPEEQLLDLVSTLNAKVVGVTLGAAGSIMWHQESGSTLHRFPTIKIRAVDTLNAGDIWHGTYAYGVANDWDINRTVSSANVAAAMKCEHFGGWTGAPRAQELFQRIHQEKSVLA
ncbi:sugar kinase [Pseudomonas baetica]|uniref:sugar kinase n=1 Tax=Pseudomonas baetica TaxID=674054 RepID=UPI003EEDAB4B